MKTTTFAAAALLLAAIPASAQKKPLDHSVYDRWESTASVKMTDDGQIVSYQIHPQDGDERLVFENFSTGRSITLERASGASISRNGHWAVFKVAAPHSKIREGKIKKLKADKMPKDTLKYMDLKTFEMTSLGVVNKHFTIFEEETAILAYEKGAKDTIYYVVKNLESSRLDTLRHVEGYNYDRFGKTAVIAFSKDKKDSLSKARLVCFNLSDMSAEVIAEGMDKYWAPRFNHETDKMLFLASNDKRKSGPKHCALYLYDRKNKKNRLRELIPQDYSQGLPEGWALTEKASPRFSRNSSRIFVGLSAPEAKKDTTLVEIDTPQLDIWNWDKPLVPPGEKLNKGKISDKTYLASLELDGKSSIVPLTTDFYDRLSYIDGGECEWMLVHNKKNYLLSCTWDENRYNDVSLVNVKTGEKKVLAIRHNGEVSASPRGKYLYWYSYDDLCTHVYNMSTGKTVNVNAALDGMFHDDERDVPDTPGPYAGVSWYDNDEAMLITEKYDLWRVTPDGGSAVNLTGFEGRRDNRQFRFTRLKRSTISQAHSEVGVGRTISGKEVLNLTVFDRNTKGHGFAQVRADKPGLLSCTVQDYDIKDVNQALKSGNTVYRKGNFNDPMDVYVTPDNWRTERRLSHINPQRADYLWGNVQLVRWTAYDGTPLEGLLYTPENLDPAAKYPMIVYFYEKNSQNLTASYSPSPSRSVINFPYCVSNGYVVFIPDIIYKDGHPGESAYNCICSGAEAMCSQFGFIDKSRMAIQGQSWGGYQVAYLVTRTDMFAAAEAGAAVSNMTSAYGGIRWGSGLYRAMQYEHGQSRIGKSLWDEGGRELYIENSPIFHADKITTPLLLMNNDNDGAVPWYQGIEMFMAVRRQQKPVWMLQYNREAHNLNERRNCKDLSIRMMQFFDHYLKGCPMPAWMKTGIPYETKGKYLGYELE